MATNGPVSGPADGYTVWFRTTRRGRWQAVGTAASLQAAVALFGCGGRRTGIWYVQHPGRPAPTPAKRPATDRAASGLPAGTEASRATA